MLSGLTSAKVNLAPFNAVGVLSSNCFFARKFDIDKYPEIISYIKNKENHNE